MEAGTNKAVDIVTYNPASPVDKPILSVNKSVINGPTKAPMELIIRDKKRKYIDLGKFL